MGDHAQLFWSLLLCICTCHEHAFCKRMYLLVTFLHGSFYLQNLKSLLKNCDFFINCWFCKWVFFTSFVNPYSKSIFNIRKNIIWRSKGGLTLPNTIIKVDQKNKSKDQIWKSKLDIKFEDQVWRLNLKIKSDDQILRLNLKIKS